RTDRSGERPGPRRTTRPATADRVRSVAATSGRVPERARTRSAASRRTGVPLPGHTGRGPRREGPSRPPRGSGRGASWNSGGAKLLQQPASVHEHGAGSRGTAGRIVRGEHDGAPLPPGGEDGSVDDVL